MCRGERALNYDRVCFFAVESLTEPLYQRGSDLLKVCIKYVNIILPYFEQLIFVDLHPFPSLLNITGQEACGFTYHLWIIFDGNDEPVFWAGLFAIYIIHFDAWSMISKTHWADEHHR